MPTFQEAREGLEAKREAIYSRLGQLDENVLSRMRPGMRRTETGGEVFFWPGLACGKLRIIHTDQTTIVVTDGVSDPWDPEMHADAPEGTFGCEFAFEMPIKLTAQEVAEGPMPQVLWGLTDWIIPERIDVLGKVMQFDCTTLAVPPVKGLEDFICPQGYMAAVSGLPMRGDSMGMSLVLAEDENGPIYLLTLKLLRPDEYAFALQDNDGTATKRMCEAFLKRGDAHLTWPGRQSIVPDLKN